MMRAARATWPSPELDELAAARPQGAHQPVVLGLAARSAGLAPLDAASAVAYETVSGPATATVRLLSLDPFDATAVLARLAPELDQIAAAAADSRTTRHRRRGRRTARRLGSAAGHHRPAARRLAGPPLRLLTTPTSHITQGVRMHLDHELDEKFPHRHTHSAAAPDHPDGTPARPADRPGRAGRLGQDRDRRRPVPGPARPSCPSPWSPTTSTPARTPTSCCAKPSCPPSASPAVETGACPHTAIRDDISANLEAVEDLENAVGPLDLILVESGGDNLTATFSKGLVDAQIFVIDVAGGDDIPRKGGPGVTTADLLVINKTDLAPYVGSDLDGDGPRRQSTAR